MSESNDGVGPSRRAREWRRHKRHLCSQSRHVWLEGFWACTLITAARYGSWARSSKASWRGVGASGEAASPSPSSSATTLASTSGYWLMKDLGQGKQKLVGHQMQHKRGGNPAQIAHNRMIRFQETAVGTLRL